MKDITDFFKSKLGIGLIVLVIIVIIGYFGMKEYEKRQYNGLTKTQFEEAVIQQYSLKYISDIQSTNPVDLRESIEFYDKEFPKVVTEEMIVTTLVSNGINLDKAKDFNSFIGTHFLVSKYLSV